MSQPPAGKRPWLRVVLILLPAALFVGLMAFALGRGDPPSVGDDAPSFEAPLLEGNGNLALADLEGKPVLMNFWASWCGPCLDEAPWLKAAYEKYGDRVHFLGVDVNDARTDALAFIEEHELAYPNVQDLEGKIEGDYGLTGQPESFLIDADGVIVEHIPGPFNGEEELMNMLEDLVY